MQSEQLYTQAIKKAVELNVVEIRPRKRSNGLYLKFQSEKDLGDFYQWLEVTPRYCGLFITPVYCDSCEFGVSGTEIRLLFRDVYSTYNKSR